MFSAYSRLFDLFDGVRRLIGGNRMVEAGERETHDLVSGLPTYHIEYF